MAGPAHMSASRTYPLAVDDAFDRLLPLPLPQLFARRYLALPAIRSVDAPADPWGTVGQTRTIHLAGGGTMREELTAVDRPRRFGYALGEITGPMKALARRVEGEWSFEPVGTGTRITWAWTVHSASAFAAPALPAFARMWRGYARRALDRVEGLLVG